ncbi:MtrB/PioB family decaheme-associated outer membrane protein [uncultured Ferrimonas sp.]|uniref:MtrB/PioB family decaheme-associated outer membrane protein n=1 Tax=uncultured Ferrimonas sp. TaxID=432640 RepID=UPI002633F299|nr:MtrB/PioB family decaheme-associated outer membrane protein [uncultured Ferrimonas sp.]
MNKNLITLAILAAAAAPVSATDFGVGAANTHKVNFDKWQCKKCSNRNGWRAELALNSLTANVDDAHASNALGIDGNGTTVAIDGTVQQRNNQGWQLQAQAQGLGLEHGDANATLSKDDFSANVSLRQFYHVDSTAARTNLDQVGNQLVIGAEHDVALELKRQQLGLALGQGLHVFGLPLQTELSVASEKKTGQQAKGLTYGTHTVDGVSVQQLAARVDQRTDQLAASAALNGGDWQAKLAYQGSQFENQQGEVFHNTFGSLYAAAPDNQAHQLQLSGNYLTELGQFDGRIAVGRMIQDDQLHNVAASPISNWDGEVDTQDLLLRYTTMVSPKLRLQASVNQRERNNNSSVHAFAKDRFDYDGVSGVVEQNVLLDSERQQAKLRANYRVDADLRVDAGYQWQRDDQHQSDGLGQQEAVITNSLWASANYRGFDTWQLRFTAGAEQRDGSQFEANDVTSTQSNKLLRKYYLADRNRIHTELKLSHQPNAKLALELTAKLAQDDYHNTNIGLTESRDSQYQFSASYQLSQHSSLYGFAAQQWIDSQQQGEYNGQWQGDIDDRFITLGAGAEVAQLWRDELSAGVDYAYADSSSDADNSAADHGGFDDYQSVSHSVNLWGRYQLSQRSAVKLDYRYERLNDSDYQSVATNAVSGLRTLGDLDHNYNAHLLMLTYSISL